MLDFASLNLQDIVLGFLPGLSLGVLIGYWFAQAARPSGPPVQAEDLPELLPPGVADAFLAAALPRLMPPSAPGEPRATHTVPARHAAAPGNMPPVPRTERTEANAPATPHLNEFGEVVNAHLVHRSS